MGEPERDNQQQARKNRFLLVVDGNQKDLFSTGMLLQNFGYTVYTLHTGREALDFLEVAIPALVIMDVDLQGTSGLELLRQIRKSPRTAAVPVLFQSAIKDVATMNQCAAEGCTLFLRKPVTPEELYRAVQSAIEVTPRKHLRISVYLKAAIGNAPSEDEFVTVLSENGMYVKTLRPRPVNTQVPVSFTLAGRTIRLDASVLYSYSFGEGPFKEPGMGLKFTRIGAGDRSFIGEYIRNMVSEGISTVRGK